MADYVWFRIPGRVPGLPAPFFLGHGVARGAEYRTDRVRQDPLPGKLTLSIALSEGGQASVGGRVQDLEPGHAVLHAVHDPSDWFGCHPDHLGRFEYLGLIFDGDAAVASAERIRQAHRAPAPLDPQAVLLRRLIALTREKTHYVAMSAAEGMLLISEALAAVLAAGENQSRIPQSRELARTAENLMAQQPAVDWSVSELARRCGVSREHLSRAFTQRYGVSPRRYLSELRIQKACARLRSSDTPIKNIMLDLGFTSHATFTRAFRRYTNTTPSQYRQNDPL